MTRMAQKRTRRGLLGAVLAAGALGAGGSGWNVVAALTVLLAWAVVHPAYVVALAHLLLPLVDGIALPTLVVLEAGMVLVLVGATADTSSTAAVAVAVAAAVLGAVGWGAWLLTETLWIAAAGIVAATATIAYGLYRYERFQLGLLGEPS